MDDRKIRIEHTVLYVEIITSDHIDDNHQSYPECSLKDKAATRARSYIRHPEFCESCSHSAVCLLRIKRIQNGIKAIAPKNQQSINSSGARNPLRIAF